MSLFRAVVLGITQGLTEYLPVSSSGHLELVRWLFGWDDFADSEALSKTFDVALHLGTLAGAVTYFRHDIVRLVRAAVVSPRSADGRLGWWVAVATVPAAVFGAVFASSFEESSSQIWLIAVMLIVGAAALAWADGTLGKRTVHEVGVRDALIIGVSQAAALQPGLSRAAITISVGRFVGLGRDAAARFAFLMSIPIVAGALIFKAIDAQQDGGIPADFVSPFFWGTVASGITGYIAVWGTLKLVRSRSFLVFVLYRVFLAIFVLALLATPFR